MGFCLFTYFIFVFTIYLATQMDAHNLSIIFGPTLIRTKADNMAAMVNDMNDQCRIIETIILHVSCSLIIKFFVACAVHHVTCIM